MSDTGDKIIAALEERVKKCQIIGADFRARAQLLESAHPDGVELLQSLSDFVVTIERDYKTMKLWVEHYEKIIELLRRQIE